MDGNCCCSFSACILVAVLGFSGLHGFTKVVAREASFSVDSTGDVIPMVARLPSFRIYIVDAQNPLLKVSASPF